MKALIQRVSSAGVSIEGKQVANIGKGLLLLLGVEKHDNHSSAQKLVHKVLNYRVFGDALGKMNLSLKDTGAELLVVSQFTLVADTQKGLRPSFSSAANPELAQQMYLEFIELVRAEQIAVQSGVFAADMQVSLVNDGPVTFLLEV